MREAGTQALMGDDAPGAIARQGSEENEGRLDCNLETGYKLKWVVAGVPALRQPKIFMLMHHAWRIE